MSWMCKILPHRYPFIDKLGYDNRHSKDVLVASHTCNRCGFFNERIYNHEKFSYEFMRGTRKVKDLKPKEITDSLNYDG